MDPAVFGGAPPVFQEDGKLRELKDKLEPEVQLDESFDTVIVIDNLPVVPPKKLEKLRQVVAKVCGACGTVQGGAEGVHMPVDDDGQSMGFAFVEYSAVDEAVTAMRKLDGYVLGKESTFRVTSYNDFEAVKEVEDEYVEKEFKEYQPKFNPRWWLKEAPPRDQYVIGYDEMTEVHWNEAMRKPEPCYSRKRWTESFVIWSPHGTYIATMHMQGIILWAGKDWANVARFEHPNVKLIDFSPCENFLVTFSPPEEHAPKDAKTVIVWDIRSGKKLREFAPTPAPWPMFRWSHDDKYLARISKSGHNVAVYDSSTLELLGKKPLQFRDVREIFFSPTDNILSVSVPEQGDTPARVQLVSVPSMKEVRSKTLFNVVSCNIHWHPDGDYLAVKVDRLKSKKQKVSNFELFRMRENDIPIETLEITDQVLAFAWEPKGIRFGIIHSAGQTNRNKVSFYKMGKKKVQLIKTLENKPVNMLLWAPNGHYLVMAGLGSLGGVLDFFHADLMATMGTGDHVMATDLAWDPSGQFLCTHVSAWRHKLENGYNIYSFRGDQLHKILKGGLYQFLWRPRPPTLLTAEKRKEIKDNLKEISKEYRKDEEDVLDVHMREDREKRIRQHEEFLETVERWKRTWEEQEADRLALRGGVPEYDEANFVEIEEVVEEVVDVTQEKI